MTTAPTHDELLAGHAAGRLPPPVAMIVATHLALSPTARHRYRRFEAAGGVLLEQMQPVPLAPDAWDRMLARLDAPAAEPLPAAAVVANAPRIPRPLRDHLPAAPEALRWREVGNAAAVELDAGGAGYRTTLIRVRAGTRFPKHTHAGIELILTLEGGFHDASGGYRRGDLQIADPSIEHQPTAFDGEDWLWLRVLDAPLRLTGPLGRVRGPFWRM
jgi:putative transcriptional regulator